MSTINAALRSDDARGRILSNLSAHSFVLDGVHCQTVESFIQGIKFRPDDPRQAKMFARSGLSAWKMRLPGKGEYVWWNGEVFVYNSPQHRALIQRAIEAKFAQNPDALAALKATQGLTIIHETGTPESPDTSLPAVLYCEILTNIRAAAL